MDRVALLVENLTKRFPEQDRTGNGRREMSGCLLKRAAQTYEPAVDSVSLQVPRGEIFGVLGANGLNLSKASLGETFGVLPLLSPEKGSQVTGIIEGAMLLVSGVYYSVSVLPGWLQLMGGGAPAAYALYGMRSDLLEGQRVSDVWATIVILLATGAVLIPLGFWLFSRGKTYWKRTGKLTRHG